MDSDVIGGVFVAEFVEHRINDAVKFFGAVVAVGADVVVVFEPAFPLLASALEAFPDIIALVHLDAEADDAEQTQKPYRQQGPADPFVFAFAVSGTHAQHRDADDGA